MEFKMQVNSVELAVALGSELAKVDGFVQMLAKTLDNDTIIEALDVDSLVESLSENIDYDRISSDAVEAWTDAFDFDYKEIPIDYDELADNVDNSELMLCMDYEALVALVDLDEMAIKIMQNRKFRLMEEEIIALKQTVAELAEPFWKRWFNVG